MELRRSPLRRYFERSIWERPPRDLAVSAHVLRRASRYLYLVVRGCFDDVLLVRAGALAYRSLLALVPLLALVLAVSKAVGIEEPIFRDFLDRLVLGQERVSAIVARYVAETDLMALGAIGLIAVLYLGLGILDEAEDALNAVWGVGKGRSLRRKLSDYAGIVLVWPLLVMLSTVLGTSTIANAILRSPFAATAVAWADRLLPLVVAWAALAFLYYFLPNTRVTLHAAVIGGIVAGSLWHGSHWAYLHFQVGVARYNALYGTFASLPIFLVWLQLSWCIALLGGEVAYAVQHEETYHPPLGRDALTVVATERAALRVLAGAWSRSATGLPPLAASDLATALDLPRPLVVHAVESLTAAGLVAIDPRGALTPRGDLSQARVGDLMVALRNAHQVGETPKVETKVRLAAAPELENRVLALHRRMELAMRNAGADLTLGQLVGPEN